MIGGGGSILTIPVLVYMFGFSSVTGSAYSLFVVGVSSFFGSLNYMKKGLLNYRMAFFFALPSLIAVYLTRSILMPHMPDTIASLGEGWGADLWFGVVLVVGFIFTAFILMKWGLHQNATFMKIVALMLPATIMVFIIRFWVIPSLPNNMIQFGEFIVTKNLAIMLLFAIVMIGASISMIRGRKDLADVGLKKLNYPLVILEGALVGTLTGVVGAGGGYLTIDYHREVINWLLRRCRHSIY